MPNDFYKNPNWQGSSGPIITRQFALSDLWPVGAAAGKDELADGLHPVVAVGPEANRPANITGVVVSFNSAANLAQLNVAEKVIVKNYVANVLTYAGGNPSTFDQSMSIGEPVYVDDSTDLAAGVTLSRSPLNEGNQANPLAGYLMYCQDEYVDSGVGGPNSVASWPKTLTNELHQDEVYCILLVNDYGNAHYPPRGV
jgi:hypothetical protein